jgi:hypothetical protein
MLEAIRQALIIIAFDVPLWKLNPWISRAGIGGMSRKVADERHIRPLGTAEREAGARGFIDRKIRPMKRAGMRLSAPGGRPNPDPDSE